MPNVLRLFVAVVVILAVGLPATAATPSEFYLAMLRRGIGAYEAGRFDAAVNPLKIAAFGLLDSIEHYQIAQLHLALTHDRLGNAELSREAARRVVIGERIEARYGSLPLTPATRANFESLAQRVLTPGDMAILGRSTASPATSVATSSPASPPLSQNTTPPTSGEIKPAPAPEAPTVEDVRIEIVKPEPPKTESVKAEPPKTESVKAEPPKTESVKPAPAKTDPVKTEPQTAEAVKPEPNPVKPAPVRAERGKRSATTPPPADVAARFAVAEEALTGSRLPDARAIYRELHETRSLQRGDLLRLAEGFYRSRDFANVLRTFDRIGPLRPAEEPYRYYIAVALYETGQYAEAKTELAAVLPFIQETPDVTRYRSKIEGAIN